MKNKTVLFLGGNSDIAISTAKVFAKNGYNLQLAARSVQDLETIISDIKIRFNVNVEYFYLDILKTNNFDNFIESLDELPDIIICCVGLMGSESIDQTNFSNFKNVLRTNFEGPAILLDKLAKRIHNKKLATIIGISSIAGIRGRGSNYIYGSAKAGFISYLSGLRSRFNHKIHVITVLPGFVNTKMTKHLSLPRLLTSSSEDIAKKIYYGYKKNLYYIYPNIIWKIIALIIRIIPEFIFKNLKF